jgi:hypothetical protein
MKMKDVKKLLTIGDTKLSSEVKEKLKEIGFIKLAESKGLRYCGRLIWEVDYGYYEVYVEHSNKERRYNENVEKVLEVVGEGFYGEIFKVVSHNVFIFHLATEFDEYYDISVIDKEELEEVGFMQVSEGFLFCGNSEEVSEALSKLVQITSTYIRIC